MIHLMEFMTSLTAGDKVYLPQMPNGQVRWNKRHVNSVPKEMVTEVPQSSPQPEKKAVAVAPVP